MRKLVGLSLCSLLAVACGDDDAPVDGGPMIDIGMTDTNMVDSGPPDTNRPDTPPSGTCNIGAACTPDRGCRDMPGACIAENATSTGSAMDPIMNGPGGATTAPVTFWQGGYCTSVLPTMAVPFPCDPEDAMDTSCGSCGVCVDLGDSSLCADACVPSVADNADCRDGYECNFGIRGCFPGCPTGDANEVFCRTDRADMNGIPGIQTPDDCSAAPADCGGGAGGATNFDPLVYNPDSEASCNPTTYQCDDPDRDATASGGDPCVMDNECELRGFCIEEVAATDDEPAAWLGGSCIKTGCDITGNGCANDGKCQERGLGVFGCLAPCTVGMGADASDPTSWIDGESARGGCRDGYSCWWDGLGAAGVADNGVCLPVDFNADVTEGNVGEPCTEDTECFSPFGRGFCLTGEGFPGGYCSVRDCAAPVFTGADAPSVCGEDTDGICVGGFGGDEDPAFAICLDRCTSAEADCRDGFGCVEVAEGVRSCFPSCGADSDCRTAQRCNIPAGMMFGDCVDR